MTDSEKLLAIVDACKEARRHDVRDARNELVNNGWQSELGYYQTRFDLAGELLSIAGHEDNLQWPSDVMGVPHHTPDSSRIGGEMPA